MWYNKTIITNTDKTIKYGYMDTKMCTIVEPKYDYAEDFYDDVAKVGFEEQKWRNRTYSDHVIIIFMVL